MIQKQNKNYNITIDEKKGIIESLSICNRELTSSQELPLFKIRMRDEKGDIIDLNSFSATISKIVVDSKDECVLEFSGFPEESVVVTVSVTFTDAILWRISVKNYTYHCIEYIDFPLFAAKDRLKGSGGDAEIFWGFIEGIVVDSLQNRKNSWFFNREPAYPCRGTQAVFPGAVEIPVMAYYGDDFGLYFGAHDTNGNVKGVDFFQAENDILFRFRLYSGAFFGEDYNMDFDLVMQPFYGNWQDAADIYRTWLDQNRSDKFKKIDENDKIPEWYHDSPVIVTYPVRGKHDTDEMQPNKMFPYINGMKHIQRLSKECDSKLMALLMHWEGTAPWAPPYVWPPYGGEDMLREFADALHKEGHTLGVYCSGIGWTIQSKVIEDYNCQKQFDENHMDEVMCVSPSGGLEYSSICTGQRSGYDMCCHHPYTTEIISDQAQKIASVGADYIQIMDQNHGGSPWFCYSRKHGHPYAPGKWETDAMTRLLEQVDSDVNQNGKKILFGSESAAAESFLPYLLFSDNRYNLLCQFGRPVPAYAHIFHEYVNNFSGNQVCANDMFDHQKTPDNVFYRLAYSLTAGDMLTLVLNEDGQVTFNWGERTGELPKKQKEILTFVANGNAWRLGNGKPFLHTGRMMKAVAVDMPEANEFALKNKRTYYADKVLTSRWKSQDGRDAQFLVNYNGEAVSCTLHTAEGARYSLFEDANGVGKEVYTENGLLPLTIPPYSMVLVERL